MSTLLDIEQSNAPQHPMLKEVAASGLVKRLTRKRPATGQQNSPTKRRAKPTGKRTGGRPNCVTQPTRGMSLQTEEKAKNKTSRATTAESSDSVEDEEEKSSTTSAFLPKRLNQNKTPLNALPAEPTRKSMGNRQSTWANALGNPVPISTREGTKMSSKKKIQFNFESPPDQSPSPIKPRLKSLF